MAARDPLRREKKMAGRSPLLNHPHNCSQKVDRLKLVRNTPTTSWAWAVYSSPVTNHARILAAVVTAAVTLWLGGSRE
jgi:hypothetical protein